MAVDGLHNKFGAAAALAVLTAVVVMLWFGLVQGIAAISVAA